MSSSQYLVIASPCDDVFEDIEDNRSAMPRGGIRSVANDDTENQSQRNPARRHTHCGLGRFNHLLSRGSQPLDSECTSPATDPTTAIIIGSSSCDHSPQALVVVQTEDESQNPAPDEKTRWHLFPSGWQGSVWAGRTAEISEHALRALLIDVLPWIVGCYIIFYAFRNGGLGLGFTVFLLLVSAHGALKWWSARGDDKPEPDEPIQSQQAPDTSTACTSPHHHHHRHPHHHHHHHHHRRGSSGSEEDYTTSDDSDLDDLMEKPVVVVDEPPPSYDAVSNPTPQDLSLGLEVHLTPREPRIEVDLSDVDSNLFSDKFLLANFVDNRMSSTLSNSSHVPTELDDEFLPSYSEAVKKTKRRRSKKSSRGKGSASDIVSDNCSYDALVNQSNSLEYNASKMDDVRITITSSTDCLPTEGVLSFVDVDDLISRHTSSSRSSIDSVHGRHVSDSPSSSPRLYTTDCNSLLMTDALFTHSSDEPAS